MAKSMGRPPKPYRTSWGETIPGFRQLKDGRWQISEIDRRFVEPDERIAVKRFREWEAKAHPPAMVMITHPDPTLPALPIEPVATIDGKPVELDFAQLWAEMDKASPGLSTMWGKGEVKIQYPVPGSTFWLWLKTALLEQPALIAKHTGIPELARLREMPLPRPSIKLEDLIDVYLKHARARREDSKKQAVAAVRRLMAHANATTLEDLENEKLLAFRDMIEANKGLRVGDSKMGIYKKIKAVIRCGLKRGMDATQIRGALDRCAVFTTNTPFAPYNPHPISRENFHILLRAATGKYAHWRLWLLLSLNLCIKLQDCCLLTWETMDMKAGTYDNLRNKTKPQGIKQLACLWPETRAELKKLLPARSPYILLSSHGKPFHVNTPSGGFKRFRKAAGVTGVTFDHIRDGAYTTAARGKHNNAFDLARIFAGHKPQGNLPNYVDLPPEFVRPACKAVYKTYGPFSTSERK